MEYVDDHGAYADIPVEEIIIAWEKIYGKDRVRNWIAGYEKSEGKAGRDFEKEEVV
jgi:hypothetical protein